MPLKLLKRTSKQYNVVSKSTFVISVTLLDNGIMECTLDSDSTGTDCLQNISQRLGLHQPEFFGLRYISRGVPPRQRWIELEQPLKKQLDKYAEDPHLNLGVMFYVSDVNLLRDEMARYHYFLQLKGDVIDGKLNSNIDQAISLAAYSLQAEFGDYDPERHTVEYLRDFAILPKELTSETSPEINLDALFDAVARQYGSLVGFPPPLAEIYYIMVAQQLDGYGQECYPAKDDSGNDILICVSVNGLVIRRRDWTHIAAFRWSNIKSLMGHKRTFVLESASSQRTMQFHFSDPEVVKYVRKICILQGTFQKENLKLEQHNGESQSQKQNSTANYAAHASCGTDSFESPPSHPSSNANLRATPDLTAPYTKGIGSQHSLNNNLAHHAKASGFNSPSFQNNSLPAPQYRNQMLQQQSMTQLHFHRSLQELSGHSEYGRPLTPTMPELPACVPMNHSLSLNPSGTTQDCDVQALLPSYRPAPDYDTAVQLKYGRPQQQHGSSSIIGKSTTEPRNFAQLYYDNQDDGEEPIYQNEIVSKIHSIELRDSREAQAQQKRTPTPEVIGQQCQQGQAASAEGSHLSCMYIPPPPYPGTSHPQALEHLHRQLKSRGSVTNSNPPLTKLRSSFNTHAEALKQISSDLNNRSIELPASPQNNSYEYRTNSHGHNNPLVSSSASEVASSKESVGSTSFVKELTKSMGAQVTRRVPIAENCTSQLEAGRNDHTTDDPTLQSASAKLPFSGKPIDPSVMKEFQGIQKAKVNPNFATGMKRDNAKKNRTPNVLPYEDNSIRLSSSRQNPDGYINASPVRVELGDRAWKYNVGQIPLSGNGNAAALWQMIWETESKIVVSLERDSSAPFYPPEKTPVLTFGDYQLTDSKNQRSTAKDSIARELIVTFLPKKKQRRVWVLPYEDEWREDVPVDTEHFLCFLEEVNSVQRKVSEDLTPLTVLCGNGAGRSGVFVLSDLLLHAADAGHKIRCDNLLSELRTERMLLVTHPPQYAFVLDTLAKYLAQSRLI